MHLRDLKGQKQERRVSATIRPLGHSQHKRHSPTRCGDPTLVGHRLRRRLNMRRVRINHQDQAGMAAGISHGDPHGQCLQLKFSHWALHRH